MRVIAGTARSIPLATPSGKDTRPTTDRIKETLFNILQPDVPGSRFLDLFSGSGGIGIEALSRGASEAVFVESGREALRCIRENLAKTKFEKQSLVLPVDVGRGISRLEKTGQAFDIIFADPPYRKGFEARLLRRFAESSIVRPGTLIVLESSRETEPDYVDGEAYEIIRKKISKTNQHIFLRVRGI